MEEKKAWEAAIKENIAKCWYRRVLQLMAYNVGDGGDIEKMVDGFVANADPADDWRDALK